MKFSGSASCLKSPPAIQLCCSKSCTGELWMEYCQRGHFYSYRPHCSNEILPWYIKKSLFFVCYVRLSCGYFTCILSGKVAQKRPLWAKRWWSCLQPTSRPVTFKITVSRQVTFKIISTTSIISRRGGHRVADLLWWCKVAPNWFQRRSLEVPILWSLDQSDQAAPENSCGENTRLDSCGELL